MKIGLSAFCTAMDYLRIFVGDDDRVTFSPQGRLVRASVWGEGCYGEYWLRPERPLAERFCVRLDELSELLAVAGEWIEYRLASDAVFDIAEKSFRVPLESPPDRSRPDPTFRSEMVWDRTLSDHLELMQSAVGIASDQLRTDCLHIDQRAQRQSIVATDGSRMIAYSERTDSRMPAPVNVLISRQHLNALARVCESKSRVRITAGLHHNAVTCGRRHAVFAVRNGRFPRWESWLSKAKEIAFEKDSANGVAQVSAGELASVCRKAANLESAVTVCSDLNGLRFSFDPSSNHPPQFLDCVTENHFGPVRLQPTLLAEIARHWPQDQIRLHYQRSDQPIVLTKSATYRRLVGLIMPMKREICHATTFNQLAPGFTSRPTDVWLS